MFKTFGILYSESCIIQKSYCKASTADNFQVQFVGISDDKEYVIPKSYVVWRKHGNLCPVCDLKSGDLYAFKKHGIYRHKIVLFLKLISFGEL